MDRFETEEEISSESGLYYMLGDPPKFFDIEGAFDFFSQKVLPRKISRNLILRDLLKNLPDKVDRNCGRLRWDFMDRMKRSFMSFRWDLNQKIDAVEQGIRKSIEAALALKKESAEEIKKAGNAIEHRLAQVRSIKNDLDVVDRNIASL